MLLSQCSILKTKEGDNTPLWILTSRTSDSCYSYVFKILYHDYSAGSDTTLGGTKHQATRVNATAYVLLIRRQLFIVHWLR